LEDSLRLDPIDCELALAEIYDKVKFPGAHSPRPVSSFMLAIPPAPQIPPPASTTRCGSSRRWR
jgi:hypothetical protein